MASRSSTSSFRSDDGRIVETADGLLRELIESAVAPGPLPERDLAVTLVLRRATGLSAHDAVRFVQLCESARWPDPWVRASVLASVTGRDEWFLDLARRANNLVDEPDLLVELMFNLQRWMFVQRQVPSATARAEIDRLLRQSYRTATDLLVARLAPPRVQTTEVRRIAILTPQILSLVHAPTRDALWLASALNERGVETIVINANCWPQDSKLRLFQFEIAHRVEQLVGAQQLDPIGGRWNQPLSIFTPTPGPIVNMARELIDLMQRHQIDAVISHETPFLQDVLAAQAPLLWIATGGKVPFGRADAIWAARELLDDEAIALAHRTGVRLVLPRELLFTLPEPASPMARESLSVARDAIMIIVVGNRLEGELDLPFIELVTEVLAEAPTAVLLLAGMSSERAAKRFVSQRLQPGQVIGMGHCEDLRGLCAVADILVNPFRVGGGTSAQTAMAEGVPIVTMAMGDVGAVAGDELSSPDLESYRARLQLLVHDADARRRESERSLARIQQRFDFDKQVDEMLATLRTLALDTSPSFDVVAAAG
jgi:glycosyltransferase involved in cell wall biosynthesis